MTKQEFKIWLTAAYKDEEGWTEDPIFQLSGRGMLYFCGGEKGKYLSVSNNGLI